MKKKLFVIIGCLAILFAACTKDNDDGIQLQGHDQNRMMDSMHTMMDRMNAMTMTNDPEIDFSEMMMMHHQGAMNMSTAQLQAGSNDSLKRFAQKVIDEQEKEMMELQSIRATLTVDNMDMEYMMEQMEGMEKLDKVIDAQLITGDIDNDYATLIIWHHQSAIDDASGYLHHGNNTQLKTIANNIIKAQTMEIQELSNWLVANKR